MGVGRDILISEKLFLVTMRTMRKHFSVSCLTSGRLAFMNQSEEESTTFKKNGDLRRGNFACEKEGKMILFEQRTYT